MLKKMSTLECLHHQRDSFSTEIILGEMSNHTNADRKLRSTIEYVEKLSKEAKKASVEAGNWFSVLNNAANAIYSVRCSWENATADAWGDPSSGPRLAWLMPMASGAGCACSVFFYAWTDPIMMFAMIFARIP